MLSKVKFIDEVSIERKTVLLRVDLNVSLEQAQIVDDQRIRRIIPTIKLLLKKKNKLILVSHLSNPTEADPRFSLKIVLERLKKLMPTLTFTFVQDFRTEYGKSLLSKQREGEILLLENIRFHEGEKKNDMVFAKELSKIADIYVNDAFAVSHRTEASIVKVPTLIPSYGGLLLKDEARTISEVLKNGKKPFVAIVGGAKIETKIDLLTKLVGLVDYILIGGGVANTFLCAMGYEIGKSSCELSKVQKAKEIMALAAKRKTQLVLPTDAVIADSRAQKKGVVKKIGEMPLNSQILDIGPDTQKNFCQIIKGAKTIVWNGPVGYYENPEFAQGTNAIYYAIAHNEKAVSVVGGGETLSSISTKELHDKVTHISTGGGAMLDFIQNGGLPGIWALARS